MPFGVFAESVNERVEPNNAANEIYVARRVLFYHSVLSGDPQAVATFRERGLAYEQAD